jgi:DNA polymerase I
MMGYEEWLVMQRDDPQDKEILRKGKLKSIQQHIDDALNLQQWLSPYNIYLIESIDESVRAVQYLSRSQALGLDIETEKTDPDHPQAGLNPKVSSIRLVQYFDGESCFIFDVKEIGGLSWIQPLLATQTIAHNALFEAQHFLEQGIIFDDLHDTMLMGRVFYNEGKSLSSLAQDALGLELDKILQTSDWGRPELLPEQIEYAAADAVVALKLAEIFEEWFTDNEPHYGEAYTLLQRLIYPIARQLSHGVPFDIENHRRIVEQWGQEQAEARALITDIDNPRSSTQKQQWLMSVLTDDELEEWPLTKRGNPSTNKEALEKAQRIPSAKPLAQYTTLSSRLSNFGEKLQSQLIDGRLYPGYKIAGMVTGRFSSSNPNIQNIPRTGFKECFRAPDGLVFVTGDLSQIELRVAGILSGDEVINDAYRNGEDLHRSMAAKMSGKDPDQITKSERTAAKAVNFGLLFGAGAKTLQQQAVNSYGVDMSLEEAEEYREIFFETYPTFHEWQQEIVEETNIYEKSESHFVKLTRHYDDKVYTHAMNFPIQSSAWEVLALSILYVDLHATEGIHISHHVYDELTLIAPEGKKMEAARLLRDAFYHGFHVCFPGAPDRGLVEIGAGKTWAEAGSDEAIIENLG